MSDKLITILISNLLLLYIVFGPIVTIWSLNNLFDIDIDYSFKNWIAAAWLLIILNMARTSKVN